MVTGLARRAAALRRGGYAVSRFPLEEARANLARARADAGPLFQATCDAFRKLCPPDYPRLDDNGIAGAGGSTGIRFSRWHAFFITLDHIKQKKPATEKPAGLAGALGVTFKRLPGAPLPPPDPGARYELATLSLRWDESRGWVEVRRPLPGAWDRAMIEEQLTSYLAGLAYDLAAGFPE